MPPILKKYRIRQTSAVKSLKPVFAAIMWEFFKTYALFGLVMWERHILLWNSAVQHIFWVLVALRTITPVVLVVVSLARYFMMAREREMPLTTDMAEWLRQQGYDVEEVKEPDKDA